MEFEITKNNKQNEKSKSIVLILVLMEFEITHAINDYYVDAEFVLILVLMEFEITLMPNGRCGFENTTS